jgi:hypothetical protein
LGLVNFDTCDFIAIVAATGDILDKVPADSGVVGVLSANAAGTAIGDEIIADDMILPSPSSF